MSDELKKYYKAKARSTKFQNHLQYDYDDDGNLIERNAEGTVIKTIALPTYRPITFEERDEMEAKRLEAIAVASNEFDIARNELNDEYQKPDHSESTLIRLNRNVEEADIRLQNARFPLTHMFKQSNDVHGIEIRKIDFTQPGETRKYPHTIAFVEKNPFELQDQYVRIGKLDKPIISVAEANAKEEEKQRTTVILFEEPDTNHYGFLSLNWAVQITMNGGTYHSAKQAIAASIATQFNDQENLKNIMIADTGVAVIYTVDMVPGDKEINEVKWNDMMKKLIYDVNILKFNQYPELAGKLLETQAATIGAYIPNDNLLGIGISLDNLDSNNPVKWTGQNLLGKALMDIREQLRQTQELQVKKPVGKKRIVAPPAKKIEAVDGLYYRDIIIADGDDVINKLDAKGGWSEVSNSASSRKIQQYGYAYNYNSEKVGEKVEDIPDFLMVLQKKLQDACRKLKLIDDGYSFNQCVVNDYLPGQGMNTHIDSNEFGGVIGCYTLGSGATLIFKKGGESHSIYVKPNSLYIMSGDARYVWTHEISSVNENMVDGTKIPRERRISVTFRNVIGAPIIANEVTATSSMATSSKATNAVKAATVANTTVVSCKVDSIKPGSKNLKEWMENPNHVYIARKGVVFIDGARFPKIDSIWANPYKIGPTMTRDQAIEKYKEYITNRLNTEPKLKDELMKLKGKELGCWCSPEPCHGDVLVELIDKYSNPTIINSGISAVSSAFNSLPSVAAVSSKLMSAIGAVSSKPAASMAAVSSKPSTTFEL